MQLYKQIELPQNEHGKYVLTAEAVKQLKRADSIVARFIHDKPQETFLRAVIREKFEGEEVAIYYDMPINVTETPYRLQGWNFCGSLGSWCNEFTHPFKELIKPGKIVIFEPYAGALTSDYLKTVDYTGDAIYYRIEDKTKLVRGLFDSYIGPKNIYFINEIRKIFTNVTNPTE